MKLDKNDQSAVILGSLFILSALGGIVGYMINFHDSLSSIGTSAYLVSFIRYSIPGIGGIIILLFPRRSIRNTIIIAGFTLSAWSLFNVYFSLFFKKLYFDLNAADFIMGFLCLLVGFILIVNTIVFLFDSTKSVAAISYCCIANIVMVVWDLVFILRHGDTAVNMPATAGFLTFFFLSQVYMVALLSSKGIKHLSLMGSLQGSIRRIRDGLRTNSGISIDRSDLVKVVELFNNGMCEDRVDFYLKTHYANVFRLVLIKRGSEIQFMIVSAKSNSLIDGFSSTLRGIHIKEEKNLVRFYGDDMLFVQLLVDDFDEKTRERLIRVKY